MNCGRRQPYVGILVLLLCFVFIANQSKKAFAETVDILRAGAAKVDITPPMGETVVGGFAPFPATNIHDKLYAKALVLDNEHEKIAFVICDNLGIAKDVYHDAKALIAKESDFPVDNILMAATHTHSATRAKSERYRPLLVKGIAAAVLQAIENMQGARIAFGTVDEPGEVFNRRWYVSDEVMRRNPFGGIDQVRMNPPRGNAALIKPAGPIDPEISFLSVQTTFGKPLALLANYSLHYVGGVNRGDISADYFGIFSNRIAELLEVDSDGSGFVGMLSNGTSGDINNINFRKRSEKMERYEKMTQVANLVAERVHKAMDGLEYKTWVELGSVRRDLTLQNRKPDAALQAYHQKIRAKDAKEEKFHRYELVYADRVQNLQQGPATRTIPLQAVRVGDVGIAAIPFEVFVEIGLKLKEKSPFGDAFTIELANDSNGYLPTPEQHKLGGYETWMGTNRVQNNASEKISKALLEMMEELK